MPARTISALTAALMTVAGTAVAASDHVKSVDNPNGCRVVERKAGDRTASGDLSTSVTAGNGHVSAHSSGGHSVTVQSGNGSTSSSVATTGSGGGQTTVTTSDGNCIIYVGPGKKKED